MPGGRPRKARTGPKKPLSAYTLFVTEVRADVQMEHPDLGFKEVALKVGEMWRHLPLEEGNKYEMLAEEDRNRYQMEKQLWQRRAELRKLRGAPETTIRRKKKKGAPRNPLSAYTFFVMENRRLVQAAHPDWNFKEVSVEVGKLWRKQTQEQCQKYKDKAKLDKLRYQNDMKKWNEKRQEEIACEEIERVEKGGMKGSRKRKREDEASSQKEDDAFNSFEAKKRSKFAFLYPDLDHREISRMIADEWRSLDQSQKSLYEEKAMLDKQQPFEIDVLDHSRKSQDIEHSIPNFPHADVNPNHDLGFQWMQQHNSSTFSIHHHPHQSHISSYFFDEPGNSLLGAAETELS